MADFFLRALLGSLLLSAVCGPLGCFLVWRRMAFFGDVLAHAALPGMALGLAFRLPVFASVLAISLALGFVLASLGRRRDLASDTLLGVLGPSSLALGLIGLSFLPGVRADLLGYLFGDILALGNTDLLMIAGGGATILLVLALLWRPLLAASLSEDLADIAGYRTRWLEPALLALLSLAIALGIQVVGVLLISALLLIPAASARALARSPAQMAVMAALIGMTGSVGGLFASLWGDLPAGAAIVTLLAGLFLVTRIVTR